MFVNSLLVWSLIKNELLHDSIDFEQCKTIAVGPISLCVWRHNLYTLYHVHRYASYSWMTFFHFASYHSTLICCLSSLRISCESSYWPTMYCRSIRWLQSCQRVICRAQLSYFKKKFQLSEGSCFRTFSSNFVMIRVGLVGDVANSFALLNVVIVMALVLANFYGYFDNASKSFLRDGFCVSWPGTLYDSHHLAFYIDTVCAIILAYLSIKYAGMASHARWASGEGTDS